MAVRKTYTQHILIRKGIDKRLQADTGFPHDQAVLINLFPQDELFIRHRIALIYKGQLRLYIHFIGKITESIKRMIY